MYNTVNKIPKVGWGTVWMSPHTGRDYLIDGNQFFFFGTMLPHLLLNPNQIRAFDINVNDNPFAMAKEIGMDCNEVFVPFDTKGTLVYFESQALINWEITHLPHIHITGNQWNPSDDSIFLTGKSCEQMEFQMISSLTSGMTWQQVNAL